MTTPVPDEPSNVLPGPGRRVVSSQARAYCGPAHGMQWTVAGQEPPAWVELPWGASSVLYRLVRRPHSHRPARDQLGYYLYVPLTGAWKDPDCDSSAQVIPLNPASPAHTHRPAPGRSGRFRPPGSA
jgi:hypothetical protein